MRYMPSRTPASSGSGNSGNRGEGNAQDGYPFGSTTPGYIDYRDPSVNGPYFPGTKRQLYQDDPNARKLHSPGSSRGEQTGWWETSGKNLSDIHSGFAAPDDNPNPRQTHFERFAEGANRLTSKGGDGQALIDAYRNAPDDRTRTAIESQLKNLAGRQSWINQGGTGESYDNRFKTDWPKPRSPLGAYSHGPGSADWDTRFTNPPPPNTAGVSSSGVRRGATPQSAPMSEGVPPSANPMMQGYGAGQVYGGQGGQFGSAGNRMEYGGGRNAVDTAYRPGRDGPAIDNGWWNQGGGYNPGQSKSGMGQNRYAYDPSQPAPHGPMMSTGGDMGMDAYNPNYMAPGMNNRMEYGNSSMQGGNMMGYGQNPYMPQGGGMQGGYMPFNGGNFSMPYDQYSGMGYW